MTTLIYNPPPKPEPEKLWLVFSKTKHGDQQVCGAFHTLGAAQEYANALVEQNNWMFVRFDQVEVLG